MKYAMKYASALYLKNSDGKFLLLKRAKEQTWCLPGGETEEGESPVDTIAREVREEISVDVYQLEDFKYEGYVCVSGWTVYVCSATLDSQEIILNEEHTEYQWVSDTNELELYANTEDFIELGTGKYQTC